MAASRRATSWRSPRLTMWYRSNTDRVLWPVTFIATRSRTPAFTIFRTAVRRRSCPSRPAAPAFLPPTPRQAGSALPGDLAVLVGQGHRGFGREHAEGHALDQIEPHRFVRVALVGDRQIEAYGQLEVAATETQHHRAVDGRRPHERAVHQFADDVQYRVASVTHRLSEPGVVTRAHGDGVRPVHPSQAQEPRRLRDAVRVRLIVVGNG